MRRLMIPVAVLTALAAVAVVLVLVFTDGPGDDPAGATGPGLATRQASAGEIDIVVTPVRLDDREALFSVTLDTHSTELDADLTEATLTVNGTAWPVAEWRGDGPGGHHRAGELGFTAAGQPAGPVVLTLGGLPEPVEIAWSLTSAERGGS